MCWKEKPLRLNYFYYTYNIRVDTDFLSRSVPPKNVKANS